MEAERSHPVPLAQDEGSCRPVCAPCGAGGKNPAQTDKIQVDCMGESD